MPFVRIRRQFNTGLTVPDCDKTGVPKKSAVIKDFAIVFLTAGQKCYGVFSIDSAEMLCYNNYGQKPGTAGSVPAFCKETNNVPGMNRLQIRYRKVCAV